MSPKALGHRGLREWERGNCMIQWLTHTIWVVPLYALTGAGLSFLWAPGVTRRTGPRPAAYVNLLMTSLAFLHSLVVLPVVWHQPPQQGAIAWLNVAGLSIEFSIQVSAIAVGAMVVVTGLNILAQIYGIGYLQMDWGLARFYALLGFFEAGMCGLLLTRSLFFSYVFLETLTLATYLIVGFWFAQPLVVTGARDAFLTKRVGDLFLLMGVLALLPLAGSWNFEDLGQWAEQVQRGAIALNPTTLTLIGLALIAGPMGKCAQFPLHLWLDEAMEGPFPASMLRNSVVVATGAWVMIQLEPVLALSPLVNTAIVAIGALTALGASLIAIAQIDIKRVLSYSTNAYMGLVFMAVGCHQTDVALLLILVYAVAIALLFAACGTVVFNCITQDLTQLGGLGARRPLPALAVLVGYGGMTALPPLGGFWALVALSDGVWSDQPWLFGVILLVNGLTVFSGMRLFGLVFLGKPQQMTVRSPEVLWPMVIPMMVLVGVVVHLPLILAALTLLPAWGDLNKMVVIPLVWSSVIGASLGWAVYWSSLWPKPVRLPLPFLQNLLAYDFYTPKLYRLSIVFGVDRISRLTDWCDRYIVDSVASVFGLATLFSGQSLKYSSFGQSQLYVLTITVGILAAIFGVIWSL